MKKCFKLTPLSTLLATAGLLGAALPPAVLAQAQPAAEESSARAAQTQTIEAVVVTAQKRKERVQDVPISVTVIPADVLERQGVSSLSDLSKTSASLEFGAPTTAVGGGGYVRGIGTNSFGNTAQASVGVVLDGVVMGNTNISSIFDIERVEILKGPQGTLFGNSVSAGVISLTTVAPDPKKMAGAISTELSAGSLGSEFTRRVMRGSVNVPLTDTSAVRLSLHNNTDISGRDNAWQGTSSTDTDNGVRLRYLAHPTGDLTFNLIADYNQARNVNGAGLLYRVAPPGSALANALADCGVTASPDNFTGCSAVVNYTDAEDRGLSAQLDWDLGSHTLTSITSYRTNKTLRRGDVMGIPLSITTARFSGCHFFDCLPIFSILSGGLNGLEEYKRKQVTQELRLASAQNKQFEYVGGLFFQKYQLDWSQPTIFSANFGGGTVVQDYNKYASVDTSDVAAFGQATYYLAPAWRLLGGARATHSKVSEAAIDESKTPRSGALATTATKVSYRLGVQHDFARNTMGYTTLATGYKGPQISDAAPGALFAVKPELPTSLELGLKTSAFNNRLAFNVDLFYTKVKDYQGQSCTPTVTGVVCMPASVPEVITKGIEFDIFGRPVRGLSLNASAIYNPAKYPSNYLADDGSNLGGTQLTRASKTKVTLSAEYTYMANATYDLIFGVDSTYRSPMSLYPSADQRFTIGAGWISNVRVGLRSEKDWSLSLFARNIGRERFPRDLFPTPFQTGGLWQAYDSSAKRVAGVQLDAKF